MKTTTWGIPLITWQNLNPGGGISNLTKLNYFKPKYYLYYVSQAPNGTYYMITQPTYSEYLPGQFLGPTELIKTSDLFVAEERYTLDFGEYGFHTSDILFDGSSVFFSGHVIHLHRLGSEAHYSAILKLDTNFIYQDTVELYGCGSRNSYGTHGLQRIPGTDSLVTVIDRLNDCDPVTNQEVVVFDKWLNVYSFSSTFENNYGLTEFGILQDNLIIYHNIRDSNAQVSEDILLTKYSLKTMDTLKTKTFGYPGHFDWANYDCFAQIGKNEYYFTFTYGDSSFLNISRDFNLMPVDASVAIGRCDSNLNVNWFQIFGDTGKHWVTDLEVLPDSTLLAAGTVFRYDTATTWNRDLFLIHLNRDGTPVDSTSVGLEELHVPTATEAPVQAVPNPGSYGFWVESLRPGPFRLEVFSAAGRHLATRQDLRPGDFVSAAGWPQGVLLLRWQLPNGTWHTQRWLRQ